MNHRITRRTLVRRIAVAGLTLPAFTPKLVRAASPNGVVRHASIGVGGMGWSDIHQIKAHPHVKIVAVCDVDAHRLGTAVDKAAPDARAFGDWRRLFDDFAEGFDSVNVTIPDHMHAPVAMRALEAGKHLYCQKPMTKWLGELFALRDRAGSTPVVTQLGIQNHARTEFRLARWALSEGLLGKVTAVHAWSNKRWGGPVPAPAAAKAPDWLDWDRWLGVAPARPYAEKQYHPGTWRNWTAFGTGLLGDMACHVFDSPMHALQLGPVQSIRSTGPAPTEQNWPDRATVHYTFGGSPLTGDKPLPLTWYDGASTVPDEIAARYPNDLPQTGSMVIGERGAMLIPHVAAPRLIPAESFRDVRFPKLDPYDHYREFIDAVRGDGSTLAPLNEYGARLVEAVLLGTVAQRYPGDTLTWDPTKKRLANENGPSVDRWGELPGYRTGW